MAAINTYTSIGNETLGYYAATLLSHAMPVIVCERYGMTKVMPRNMTKTIQFRRSKPFSPATSPLQEGATPAGSIFGYDTVTAQIQQFGDFTTITDVIQDTSKDKVLRDMGVRQGEQIGETKEKLTWDVIRAGTSVTYAGGVSTRKTVAAKPTISDFRNVIKELDRQKAKKITEVLSGSERYHTFPVEAAFVGVGHTDLKPSIRSLANDDISPSFVPTSKYGSSQGVTHPKEIGSVEEIRIVLSPDLDYFHDAGASSADVYPLLVMGREAWGCIALRGRRAVTPMILNVNKARSADPLGQRGSIGWKMWYSCVVLNESWMNRLEVLG